MTQSTLGNRVLACGLNIGVVGPDVVAWLNQRPRNEISKQRIAATIMDGLRAGHLRAVSVGGMYALELEPDPAVVAARQAERERLIADRRARYEAATSEERGIADHYESLHGKSRKLYGRRNRRVLHRLGVRHCHAIDSAAQT